MNSNLFYVDSMSRSAITISDLVDDISRLKTMPEVCCSANYSEVFKQIIASLIFDLPIILLDSDMTQAEKDALVANNTNTWDLDTKLTPSLNADNFIDRILSAKRNWTITLFTSGTTGLPKKISHNFESITRSVKSDAKYRGNIWGFAYNPTHMAGIQVFLQALINQNTIVRLFGMSKEQIFESIDNYKITHISATPTFYRLLLPSDKSYPSVVKLTSGGEKFDSATLGKLQLVFPQAKITNVYASTEAGSLLATDGDCFVIKAEHEKLFRIENEELLIHQCLLGDSDTIAIDGHWYHTNDIVEVVGLNPTKFKFCSRKNEMINVGGYKVNPNEIEDVLRQIDVIKEALVYGKTNRLLGNIICCDIVLASTDAISEAQIRADLTKKLQEFKIPRIINFVDQIKTTRTGKISRK